MNYKEAKDQLNNKFTLCPIDCAEDCEVCRVEAVQVAIKAIETVERLVEVVPNNTPYCYTPKDFDLEKGIMHVERCPFWKIRHDIEWDCDVEYCALLGKDLEVQDSVKDCGISCEL